MPVDATSAYAPAAEAGPAVVRDNVIPEAQPRRGRRMGDKQVLFRLDEELLARLDRRLGETGYKTRNAWFKAVVEDFITNGDGHR